MRWHSFSVSDWFYIDTCIAETNQLPTGNAQVRQEIRQNLRMPSFLFIASQVHHSEYIIASNNFSLWCEQLGKTRYYNFNKILTEHMQIRI